MKKHRSFILLIVATSMVSIQSCKLERLDPQCPTVTGIQPNAAHSGSILKIIGKNFNVGSPGLYKVSIGSKLFEVIDVPHTDTLRVKVPIGIDSGPLSVSLASGTVCNISPNIYFTYYYTVTKVGTLNDKVLRPSGLDLDNDGDLVVGDLGHYQIQVIDTSDGTKIETYGKGGPGFGCDANPIATSEAHFYPDDIDVDSKGNIFIAEGVRSIIRWIDPSSTNSVKIYAGRCNQSSTDTVIIHRDSAKLDHPISVFRDTSELYFIDAIGIRRISNSLVNLPKKSLYLYGFTGIEINRSRKDMGPIFVIDDGCGGSICFPEIVSVDGQGRTKFIRNDKLISPKALALDSRGNIFVADAGADKIFVIYTNDILEELSGSGDFKNPAGIALAEKDGAVRSIYISDSEDNKVKYIKIQ